MSQTSIRSYRNKYLDSVKLLAASRALLDTPGIQWGTVVTGTPANIEVLIEEGFDSATLSGLTANDLVMAARGGDADRAFSNAEQMMFNAKPAAESANEQFSIRSLTETMGLAKPPNLAVISVGGAYAALEAHKAIGASMDVLLFSDNVALDDEIELKRRAAERSLFLMGPGAGTAMIDGVGLGFANVVRGGSIGVVAAAGTGAQEVMSLIDRAGLGVSQVIGVGGRDLSEEVGGVMTELAIQSFEDDPKTEAILVVSKPPSPTVSKRLLNRTGAKPIVAVLIGLDQPIDVAPHVRLATDLEEGVIAVTSALGAPFVPDSAGLFDQAVRAIAEVDDSRKAVRGLFSGGTLCFESMTLIAEQGLDVYSNTPLRSDLALESAKPDSHVCLDLGEEEYTRGRPHPMIDPAARIELIQAEGAMDDTAVILIDVVLGYGSHDDPAGQLATACANVMAIEGGPQVVAYVLGTDSDPQGIVSQRAKLEEVGCIVAPTNARAALTAIAIATRRPEISEFRRNR